MVYFLIKDGNLEPFAVPTSKRRAVSMAIEAMLSERSLKIEDMAEAKQQLNTQGKTVGFKTNYSIKEIPTNKVL